MTRSIDRIKRLLVLATEAGHIKWVPVGEIAYMHEKERTDLETNVDGATIRIVIRNFTEHSRFWGDSEKTLYGLVIENDKEKIVFSSDPDHFVGEKPEGDLDLMMLAYEVHRIVEEKDIMGSVRQSLSRLMYP